MTTLRTRCRAIGCRTKVRRRPSAFRIIEGVTVKLCVEHRDAVKTLAELKPVRPQEVHWCNWAGQPDIGIACGRWTTPAYHQPHKDEPYLDDHGALYAFTDSLVTCPACRVLVDEGLRKQADEQVDALRQRATMTDEERAKGDAFVAHCNAIVEKNNPDWQSRPTSAGTRVLRSRDDAGAQRR